MSAAIAVLVCRNKCSIQLLTSSMSFHPPQPPSYRLETQADGSLQLCFANPQITDVLELVGRRAGVKVDVRLLRTSRRQSIPLFHFKPANARLTLLWSHANAMDCGEMYFFFLELASRLNVNVAAYDYSGYGAATGEPTESNAYADADAVLDYLASAGVDVERQVVLYGQSIGSAPTLYLASRHAVAATILHSPILSGLRFLVPPPPPCSAASCCSPRCVYALCDPFPNFKRIRRVSAPVLLIHGTADETVDCSHTYSLYERVPEPHRRAPYIIPGAGHETVVDHDPEGYFTRVHAFLRSLGTQPADAPTAGGGLPAAEVGAPLSAAARMREMMEAAVTDPTQPMPPVRGDGIDHRLVQPMMVVPEAEPRTEPRSLPEPFAEPPPAAAAATAAAQTAAAPAPGETLV